MSVDETALFTRRWTWPQIIFCVVLAGILVAAAIPTFHPVSPQTNQIRTASNCRQIIAALRVYALDHGGRCPDSDKSQPPTSNDAFRILIREGVLEDERIFGAKSTKYFPDNQVGDAPEFKEALEAFENHWAMTKGVTDKSNPKMPLVFENPVSGGWPPAWNCDAAGRKEKGRAWRGGKIIVGFNDGSVETIKLESDKGSNVRPARDWHGKDVFTRAADSMEILDILE